MKLLAIEKEISKVNWDEENEVLINESYRVYKLFQDGVIREIYFNQNDNAIIVLESGSIEDAQQVLSTLPLVEAGLIHFDVMELRPYTGFSRIMYKLSD